MASIGFAFSGRVVILNKIVGAGSMKTWGFVMGAAVRKSVAGVLWQVYIIECAGGRLYTGITTDLQRRLKEHQAGKGARFTRAFGAYRLYYNEACPDLPSALRREAQIKKMPRAQKIALRRN